MHRESDRSTIAHTYDSSRYSNSFFIKTTGCTSSIKDSIHSFQIVKHHSLSDNKILSEIPSTGNLTDKKSQKMHNFIIRRDTQSRFSSKLPAWFFHQRLNRHFFSSRKLLEKHIPKYVISIGSLIDQKWQKARIVLVFLVPQTNYLQIYGLDFHYKGLTGQFYV